MKVILMQDVAKLGRKYEVKDVTSGYALNLLIPSGKAVMPNFISPAKLKNLQDKHHQVAAKRAGELTAAIVALTEKRVVISGKASKEGHLFAGIGKEAIASAMKEQLDLTLDFGEIHLGHALKEIGPHKVEVGEGNTIEVIVEAEV